MSSDRSVLKRNTATLSQLMAVGAMSVLSCDQSIPVAEPQIEQQKQAIVSSQEAPSTSLPAAAPPVRPSTSTIQKSVGGTAMAAPKVMYRGCRVVQKTRDGLLCLQSVTSRTVLWVEATPCEQLEVRDDKQPVAVDASYIEGGCQLKQKEPSKPPRSTLSIHNKDTGTSFWSLQTDRSKPWLMEWTDRMWRRATIDLVETEAELQAQALQQTVPEIQLDLLMARAVVLFRLGQTTAAIRFSSEVVETAHRYGFDSIAFDAARLRWNALLQAGLLEDAWIDIEGIKPLQDDQSSSQVAWELDAGQLLMELGKMQDAELYLRKHILNAKVLNLTNYPKYAIPWHARVLLSLDRFDDAWAVHKTAVGLLSNPHLGNCAKAELLVNLADNILLFTQDVVRANRTEDCSIKQARAYLEQALELRQRCPNDMGQIYVGLAQVAFAENRITDAMAHLDQLASVKDATYVDKLNSLDVRGRVALTMGKVNEAQKHFEAMSTFLSDVRQSHGGLFSCKAAVGQWKSSLVQGRDDNKLLQDVDACLQSETIATFDRRIQREQISALRASQR